ncbi:MAG TPA: hypothetical protein VHW26_11610 [Solirubrobacteraceae bacterium]|jgi:hypothetical protein|nr:hypothetical protein [Solirubrobacteraceae bacterium]
MRPGWSGPAIFPGGVLAVHELRYLLAYGADAGHELHAHGDTYVGTASLLAGLLVAIPAVGVGFGVIRARRGNASLRRARLRPWQSWLVWAVLLTVGFCGVEGLEMVFESEHPGGFAGVFGAGGWWAVPAAVGVAAVFTLARRGARALVRLAARPRRRRADRAGTGVVSGDPVRVDRRARQTPLASGAAGRAPPRSRPVVHHSP